MIEITNQVVDAWCSMKQKKNADFFKGPRLLETGFIQQVEEGKKQT